MTYAAATKTLQAHINTYATEVNKTFGNATVFTARAGGLWEPNLITGPLTGDLALVTPSHTDLLTGMVTQGVPQSTRQVFRRDTQEAKVERYLAGQRITQTLRAGIQFEEVREFRESAYPSNVQYYDYGGAPDYALFRNPSVQGASYSTQGGFGEDQLTVGNRTTFSLGVRYDHMHAVNQDLSGINSQLQETGTTIPGLGGLFTWNFLAPRVGLNVKLASNGGTVLRSTYGRAYRQIIPQELDLVSPGISSVTQANFVPATGGYTQVVSVTNTRTNLAIDPSLSAPRQDTFSIGVDHQIMPQVAVSASYVYKKSTNLLAWRDIGGIYGTQAVTLPNGQALTVNPLLNSPSQRLFLWTNRSDYVDRYNGFITSLTKRLSHRWQGQVNLTLSRSEGLEAPTAVPGNFGQDPDDLINAYGRLMQTDRPVMVTANGSYEIPRIDVLISPNYQNVSALPYAPQASLVLPQGRRSINIAPPGSFRPARIDILNLRIDKIVALNGHRQLELMGNVVNLFQNQSPAGAFATFNYFSPTYAQPISWVQPRELYFGARVRF